jgi:acetylornithine deacetylase/succinyl-diaminopimelate desuccinylase-like protein
MKGGVAMLVAAFLRASASQVSLPGDVILCILADEEAGGDFGARFLTEQHPQLFAGVRYALGEFGGFTHYAGDRRLYPIMVAEKQSAAVRATVRGPAGHAAFPLRGGAAARLAAFLQRLDRQRLPVHITPVPRLMIETLSGLVSPRERLVLRRLLAPKLTDRILDLAPPLAAMFDPLLHNTANATIIRGGEKNNVIPSEITVDLDVRVLPGYTPQDALTELRALAGPDVEFELIHADTNPATAPDLGLFETLAGALIAADPEGQPLPYMLAAVTDARLFTRLGIQSYGFLPMRLPPGWDFPRLIHAADERIPVEALAFGADAVFQVLQRFGGSD